MNGNSVALSRIDAGGVEDTPGDDAFRTYANAFALELREIIQSLRSAIK